MKSLSEFNPGDIVIFKEFNGNFGLQSRLVEMGFVPGIKIRIVKFAPLRGLIELKIRNYYVSVRMEDAKILQAEKYSD